MDNQKPINDLCIAACTRSAWFEQARELIQRSEQTTADALDWIENQIRSGCILLYRVERAGEFIGIFTGCIERDLGKPSNFLVIHAVSVEPQDEPFICTLFPLIHGLAEKSGLASWTVRSQRPGMDKRLEQHGFEKLETIYKRKV